MRAFTQKLLATLLVFALAGCAAEMDYRGGQSKIAQGDVEAGLVQLQDALRAEPNNARYRAAYVQARERAMVEWQRQAELAAARGDNTAAESWYQRMLALEPGNARATGGLATLQRAKRLAQWREEADTAWARGDAMGAMPPLRALLAEKPDDTGALALKKAIEEKTFKSTTQAQLAASLKKPITIEFKDTSLKQVFEVLSRTSGLNFIFDKDVRTDARTTVFLRNTTVENAVNMVLLTNQLEQRVLDSYSILVYPNSPAKSREYQPLVVKTFFLANADAKIVANTLRTIVKSRDVVIDDKQNMIIVRDTPEAIRLAEKLVAMHDLPEPEVMLDVEVLEVNRTRLIDAGIQWPSQVILQPLPGVAGGTLTVADLRKLSQATIGATVSPTTITLNQQNGDANILANPRIRSRNHEKAKILVGNRVPNITTTSTSTGFVSDSVQYLDVGLKLEVEPTIYPNNEIAIKLGMEVSTVANQITTRSGSVAYQIGTRNANTVIRLKDGESQVLAGLINDEDRRTINGIPGLSTIPILGRLFGDTSNNGTKTEIVLTITPHLIRPMVRPDLASSEFDAGTEASLRNRGGEGPASGGMSMALSRPPGAAPAGGSAPPSAGVIAAGAVPAAASAASAGSAALTWEGPAITTVGSTFTISLNLQAGDPVISVPVAIGYDARLLEVVEVTEGTLMRQDSTTAFSSRVDRSTGQIFATIVRNSSEGTIGSGSLLNITFRANAPAPDVRLQLLAASPIGSGGKTIGAAMPAPQSIAINPP